MSTTPEQLAVELEDLANICAQDRWLVIADYVDDLRAAAAMIRAAAARLDEAERENARLREALKPFAKHAVAQFAKHLPPHVASDDATPVWGNSLDDDADVTVGDLRRAAALAGTGEK
jgi:hypothetical protein